MKVLLIGAGGIGSFFAGAVNQAWSAGVLASDIDLTVADFDVVEPKNVWVQNFTPDDVGKLKVDAIEAHFPVWKARNERIDTNTKGLLRFDCIILAVDNVWTRECMMTFCHVKDKHFIDMRAFWRQAFVMPKGETLEEDLATLDLADKESGSCQKNYDRIEFGHRVAAAVGLQMFVNWIRGTDTGKFAVRL